MGIYLQLQSTQSSKPQGESALPLQLPPGHFGFGLVGSVGSVTGFLHLPPQAAPSPQPILLQGESGLPSQSAEHTKKSLISSIGSESSGLSGGGSIIVTTFEVV